MINYCHVCGRKFSYARKRYICKNCYDLEEIQRYYGKGHKEGDIFVIKNGKKRVVAKRNKPVIKSKKGYKVGNESRVYKTKKEATRKYNKLRRQNNVYRKRC